MKLNKQGKKKILVISQIASHPPNMGIKRRIYNFFINVKKLGHKVYFVCEGMEGARSFPQRSDIRAMKKSWDKVYMLPLNYFIIKKYIDRRIGMVGIFLRKNFPKTFKILKKIELRIKNKQVSDIDSKYNPNLDKFIKKILKKEKFDIVIVQYIPQARILDLVPDTIKMIDTHDVAPKTIINKENSEMIKSLNKADVIIAIQEQEERFFRSLVSKNTKAVTIGDIYPIKKSAKKDNRKNIMFVGFPNKANIQGVNFFVKQAFPKIRKKFPNAKFLLVGGRYEGYSPKNGIMELGLISKDIKKAYDLADIVICPLVLGRGIKIKCVEALAHGKPFVTTSHGAVGLEKGKNKAFLIADTADQFVKQIEKIFTNKKLGEKLSKGAQKFMKEYNKENLERLKKIIEG